MIHLSADQQPELRLQPCEWTQDYENREQRHQETSLRSQSGRSCFPCIFSLCGLSKAPREHAKEVLGGTLVDS
uniref:Uncharacterized protein n=1 Tax=Piliocolobus tephrosceles TaxID=591936 RepID=A0A8C9GB83_9PRIM